MAIASRVSFLRPRTLDCLTTPSPPASNGINQSPAQAALTLSKKTHHAMTATVVRRRVAMMATIPRAVAPCRQMAMIGELPNLCNASLDQLGFGHGLIRLPSAPKGDSGSRDEEGGAINPGSNLFVTGIHPRLEEAEVTRLFEKYGEVEKCQIMKDPHTGESRGFGFVKMVTSDMADAAKEGLQGEVIEGRTLSIEKARRSRPRTPTPGKYFGPPKRGKLITAQLVVCG
jgi:hypothetical protein